MAWDAVAGPSRTKNRQQGASIRHRFVTSAAENGVDEGLSERLDICPLYEKTGACRFGRTCTNLHPTVRRSRILLLSNMYRHPALDRPALEADDERQTDTDAWIEHDEEELCRRYNEFRDDVKSELETHYGPLRRFIVCRNLASHLRGNVYVEFKR